MGALITTVSNDNESAVCFSCKTNASVPANDDEASKQSTIGNHEGTAAPSTIGIIQAAVPHGEVGVITANGRLDLLPSHNMIESAGDARSRDAANAGCGEGAGDPYGDEDLLEITSDSAVAWTILHRYRPTALGMDTAQDLWSK
jgi:hypothetical protein